MLLSELRTVGFAVSSGPADALVVSPASRLTGEQRAQIRLHKHEILRELAAEAAERHAEILSAGDSSGLEEWRAPLTLGRLHLCANCSHFTFDADPADLGYCSKHRQGLAPFLPFECVDFEMSAEPTAPDYLPDPDGAIARARARSA